ncbi:MAG: MBL fold metallo-hydrolase RNA specificity domain-containing protein [Deltaproteobacteria bacterium]
MKKTRRDAAYCRLQFLGGVRTVTGSSHLLTTPKARVLIDAGLFYGRRADFYSVNTTFAYAPQQIDALVLSHAHIDHCGNIPTLVKRGLRGRVYATSATRDLCRLMLADSGHIQEEDARYLKKLAHRARRQRPRRNVPRPEVPSVPEPLYTERDALRAMGKFRPLAYGQRFSVAPDTAVTFYDAGHILGASVMLIEVRLAAGTLRLGYAVDLGRKELPMLNEPVVLPDLDYLILESTYGSRTHSSVETAKETLRDVICRTVARGGKIVIPAFALERTQEVIYCIARLLEEKAVPPVPIYVDSPLAIRVTEVFRRNVHYLDEQVRDFVKQGSGPFDFADLHYVQSQFESKALNVDKRPMIILAGSGMCEAGRVLHHLKNNITESRNTILVVGYMAKDTLGKRIVDKEKLVRIYGMEHELNAEVVVINALSGHADKNDLLRYAREADPRQGVFLVHGDEEETRALYEALAAEGIAATMPLKDEEVLLRPTCR